MPRGFSRPLTDGEVALARTAFGDGVPYAAVTLIEGRGLNPLARLAFRRGNGAITLGRSIYYNGALPADFAMAPVGERALFFHEMTHVWQCRRLGLAGFLLRYLDEFFAHRGDAPAMYRYAAGVTCFGTATLEAQAQMVGDYGEALWTNAHDAGLLLKRSLAGSGLFGGL